MGSILHPRQQLVGGDSGDDYNDGSWWYSSTALIIKWSVITAIFVIFMAWFVGGYYHARRRMKKGLPPLAYHRWLVPRSQRMRFEPQHQNPFSFYQSPNTFNDGHQLQTFPPPPPGKTLLHLTFQPVADDIAYNTDHVPPPIYQPVNGFSKVDPDQDYAVPPPGPPPTGGPSSASHHYWVDESRSRAGYAEPRRTPSIFK
ncbi:hypothetical protein MMC12_003068 [Toensbergia leucococca]|nr:hypothetical protein [Toensbergia leucococca]